MYDDCKFELSNGRILIVFFSSAFAITRNKKIKKNIKYFNERKECKYIILFKLTQKVIFCHKFVDKLMMKI